MSSSGGKQLQMNPLERALSMDINRLQEFAGSNLSTVLQALFDNGTGFDDVWAGAQLIVNSTVGNPAFAEVLAGIVFVPTNAATACTVLGGLVAMLDPDTTPNPDDSQYKVITDPGTNSTLTPSLVFTANASGSIRIDVLECSRVQPDTVIETDNRDVYNPVLGTFTAVTLNKVTQANLQYRIRLGVGGAGFPGTAAGWMPICVMSVPTGTVNWDNVCIWDVRPLLEDRVKAPLNASVDMPRGRGGMFYSFSTAAGFYMTGLTNVAYVSRFLGGRVGRGSPGADSSGGVEVNFVDFNDTANQELAMSTADGLKHIYLLTPFGLPRWARFTDAAVGVRQARSPRGIMLMSAVGPAHAYGVPSAPITFPAIFGFGAATTLAGVCIASVQMTATVLRRQTCAAGKVGLDILFSSISVGGSGFGGQPPTSVFTLTENVNLPAGVRRVHLLAQGTFTTASGVANSFYGNPRVSIGPAGNPTEAVVVDLSTQVSQNPGGGAFGATYKWDFWIELPNDYPATTPDAYTVTIDFDLANLSTPGLTSVNPILIVMGWEYGDL
jgi:hypothetical protein